MKILVCISKTPDTTTKIAFKEDNKEVNYEGVKFILNPYDEHALSKAMELKEKHGGEITIIHVGDAEGDQIIRKCFAVGADKGIRINTEALDALQVAKEIVNATSSENYDVILTGRESIDYNGGMVAEMIGQLLNIPSVSYCQSLEIDGNSATMKRFIDGGEEVLKTDLPVVVSAVKELGEPRIPNMRGIMQARTKKIEIIDASSNDSLSKIQAYEPPKPKAACHYIDAENAEELIQILHNEKKLF